jgi:hypothetical protein
MTVSVVCNLSDGIVLGVDSAVTLGGPGGVVKVYENAEKLFSIGEKPIGAAIFGLAGFGNRTIGGYINEFESKNPSGVLSSNNTQVSAVVEELRKLLWDGYQREVIPELEKASGKQFADIPVNQRPVLGVVIGGFSDGAYLSEVWQFALPLHTAPGSAVQLRAQGSFGSNWFASYVPIQRYIKGFDQGLIDEVKGYLIGLLGRVLTPAEDLQIAQLVQKYEYQIPYPAMPMLEGVEHVRFLVELVVKHHRFAVGAPIVGGAANIGMVTYRGGKFKIL